MPKSGHVDVAEVLEAHQAIQNWPSCSYFRLDLQHINAILSVDQLCLFL
jgi:hypothetical protein